MGKTIDRTSRVGSFSSSEIWKLMKRDKTGKGFGAPALTYIEEKKMELRLQRPLKGEVDAKATNWGTFVEKRAFDLMGMEYRLESEVRLAHDTIDHWTGAPDCTTEDTVVDIKCPFTLKSFCQMVDAMNLGVDFFRDEKPEYFWQLTSNAILAKKKFAEIVIYVPYKAELQEIREMAQNLDGDQNKISFINWTDDDALPYLLDGEDQYYKNIVSLKWEVSESDKDALELSVKQAVGLLVD